MSKKIEGIDVSHWNSSRVIKEHKPDFVIIKLTEGKTYLDDAHLTHYLCAKQHNAATGFYHYARAENNRPEEEADWFVSNLPLDAIGKSILVLDFEGKSLSIDDTDGWAYVFMARVFEKTGVKPLLYCSQAEVKQFEKVQAGGFGLWVARYRNKMLGYGDISPWKFAAIWQYTSSPVDKDVFYGTVEQFYKYAKKGV